MTERRKDQLANYAAEPPVMEFGLSDRKGKPRTAYAGMRLGDELRMRQFSMKRRLRSSRS